jgi:uncharacterized UPF0160 family protein
MHTVMITIATHSGNFHADDVFACAALQLFLGIDAVRIVRTREIATIEAAGVVDAHLALHLVAQRLETILAVGA